MCFDCPVKHNVVRQSLVYARSCRRGIVFNDAVTHRQTYGGNQTSLIEYSARAKRLSSQLQRAYGF